MSHKRVKVVMIGPVNGQLRLLSDKLRSLQKKGPFDVCVCAGPFFHQAAVVAADKETDPRQKENDALRDAAVKDGKDLVDGALTFDDIPVLFADEGDGFPAGIKLTHSYEVPEKDEDEIELDEEDEGGDEEKEGKGEEKAEEEDVTKTPDGLLRIAQNLYQLKSRTLDSVADIVSVPFPLADGENTANNAGARKPAMALTIGFLGPRVRLPCQQFMEKAKHVSFLGCDILVSGEWGQGMSSGECGALTAQDRAAVPGELGSYDVAELVAAARPRYHLAQGPLVPVDGGDGVPKIRRRFVASRPYGYPSPPSCPAGGGGGHAGRFLALGSVLPAAEAKILGKAFKYVHAVGIVPLAFMDDDDREAARERALAVECPYTDAAYGVDHGIEGGDRRSHGDNYHSLRPGGLSEARARRLAQEDAVAVSDGGAYRWQQRGRKRSLEEVGNGRGEAAEAVRQAAEASNPDNRSLFLHGLHRDPGLSLTPDTLMDAFRPFGCVGIRFPKPKRDGMNGGGGGKPSFAFLDFNTHDEARACLSNLNGSTIVCNITLTLKWSSSPNKRPQFMHNTGSVIPPPPPPRRNRLTEAEAADSTTLFLRLPPTLDSSSYPEEMETMRLLVQGTLEEELNVGTSLDSPNRVTAKDEPALRVTVRHPNKDMIYGFLELCSHAAALTALVSLTGNEDGGVVKEEKLRASCLITEEMEKRDLSHLQRVVLHWAKGGGGQQITDNGSNHISHVQFQKRHFPPDSRTDCWFCLASPTCEKHLIVAVHDQCYVTMPKGAVNESHVLVVPIEHSFDGAMVNRKLAPEIELVKSKLRDHAQTVLQKDLFVFERCIQTKGGYHDHVQCIPICRGSGPTLQSTMLEMASRAGFALKEITSDLSLSALEDDWSGGYFYAEIPLPAGGNNFRRFIYRASAGNGASHPIGGVVPLQFGREVLAEVLGNADVGQWKACVVSQEKEKEWTTKLRTSLLNVSA